MKSVHGYFTNNGTWEKKEANKFLYKNLNVKKKFAHNKCV